MTVIAAIKKGHHTYIAADTATTDDSGMVRPDTTKLWQPNPKLVLGLAGSGGQMSEAVYGRSWKSLKVPVHLTPDWVFRNIYNPIAKLLEKHTKRTEFNFDILVATSNSLYMVFEDGTILPGDPFVSIGCGALYARGYYDAASKTGSPEKLLRDMIKHCGACVDGVSPDAVIKKL